MTVEQYLNSSKRRRRALARRALKGDIRAQKELIKFTNAMKATVNKQLRKLKKANLNYGREYNEVAAWLDNINLGRLASARELNFDYEDMLVQNEIGYKFLKSGWSDPFKARLQESYRVNSLIAKEILPKGTSRQKALKFLRWLGSEESNSAMDEYGRSEVFVEMAYQIWEQKKEAGLIQLTKELLKFLDHEQTFDEVAKNMGVDIEKIIDKQNRF